MLKSKRTSLTILFIWLISQSAFAADAAQTLTLLLNNVDKQQGLFEQVLINEDGETAQSSSGKFALKQPGQFRWETLAPFAQVLISDGATLWLYDPDLEQVTVRSIDAAENNPMALISGQVRDLSKDYNVTQLASENDHMLFRLQPKLASDYFRTVTLSFNKGQLSEMLIRDLTGNTNRILLSGVTALLPDQVDLFTFSAPAGTDVIIDG